MNFEIPEGLTDLLQDFTYEVLRKKPADLLSFAAQYFDELLEKRGGGADADHRALLAQLHSKADSADAGSQHSDEDEDDIMDMPNLPKHMLGANRRHSVAAEKYNPEEDTSDEPDIVHPKEDNERDFLRKTISNIFIFRSLEEKQINKVLDAMFGRKCEKGDVIIEQGDDGDNFYIIETGTFDIFVNKDKVGAYEGKGSFGELALMYNMPRAATIVARTSGKLYALDRLTFKRIVLKTAFEKRKMYESLLDTMPMFKSLSPYERMNVADALFSKSFKDGEAIIKQGDEATCMFFVESGKVKVCREQDGLTKELKVYSNGEYFGELALITKNPRAASAYAVGSDEETKCAILDVYAFERLLGPCLQMLKKNIPDYEDTLRNVFGEQFNLTDIEK